MCINCNILAPLTIPVCDLLGLPRGIFYSNHYNLDILNEFIRSIWCASVISKCENTDKIETFVKFEAEHPPQLRLLNYIIENDMIEEVFELFGISPLNPKIPTVTDTCIINAHTCHLFHFKTSSKISIDDYMYDTRIPLELLSSYPYYIRAGINFRAGCYQQIKPFDDVETENEFELVKASALYGIHMYDSHIISYTNV